MEPLRHDQVGLQQWCDNVINTCCCRVPPPAPLKTRMAGLLGAKQACFIKCHSTYMLSPNRWCRPHSLIDIWLIAVLLVCMFASRSQWYGMFNNQGQESTTSQSGSPAASQPSSLSAPPGELKFCERQAKPHCAAHQCNGGGFSQANWLLQAHPGASGFKMLPCETPST